MHGATTPQVRAIHQLTEVVAQATEPAAIHEAALDALIGALGADRATILLFDAEAAPPVPVDISPATPTATPILAGPRASSPGAAAPPATVRR
jgi:hypothetical protein